MNQPRTKIELDLHRENTGLLIFQRLHRLLWSDVSPALAYGLAGLLAVAFIRHIFPLTFLIGNGGFLEEGDAAQHVTGWLFYVQDTWHFPLLLTERLNHPEGVSIAFTDSIPLAALLFKTIASWLPAQFHYIGLWHAVVFVTQALAATFLIRSLGLRHILATLSAVFFAVTWPALLWRLGHTSLMTHSIILCALAFYFLGRHGQWRSNTTTTAFIIISLVGLTIHPYFLAFCYTLFLVFLADQAIAGEGWKKQLPRLLVSVAIICATGVVLGYFGNGALTSGFDLYSMNLIAPFCGGRFYSCVFDANGGQYEGYNYFGIGVLLLLAFVIVTEWSTIKTLPKRYPALTVALILLCIYALSTRIYVGSYKLLSYSLPSFLNGLIGTFRASGRFFWVVGYLILFATLVALLKKPTWRNVLLLAIAIPLQWADEKTLRDNLKQNASKPSTNEVASWEKVATNVDKIHIYPTFGCSDHDAKIYLYFQRVASRYGKLLDTGYTARRSTNCANRARFFDASFQSRHLYVSPTDYLKNPNNLPAGFKNALQRGECVKWRDVTLCQTEVGEDYWKKTGLQIEPATLLNESPNK